MMNKLGASILGGDPFSHVFRGLYDQKSFWNLTDPDYCYSVMEAAYAGGCRAFDYSFPETQALYLKLSRQVEEETYPIANITWLQGFHLEGRPLQYCRDRVIKTIVSSDTAVPRPIQDQIDNDWSKSIPMVFGYDGNAPALSQSEIDSIDLCTRSFLERLLPISHADFIFMGGTDADWLFALRRHDLIAKLARLLVELGKTPILLCHYTSLVLPVAESMPDLPVQGYAVPLNQSWSWFSLEDSLEAVSSSQKPVIAFMPFGSGDLASSREQATEFLSNIDQVCSLLFGTSKAKHAQENAQLIGRVFERRRA